MRHPYEPPTMNHAIDFAGLAVIVALIWAIFEMFN